MKALLRVVLVVLVLVLVAADCHLLFTPPSHHVEGDVLIHLVFARNMAHGRWFEYGGGRPSRAGTSLTWEVLLAVVGKGVGCIDQDETFLGLARVLSILFLLATSAMLVHVAVLLGARRRAAWLAAVCFAACPIVFYWCFVNPMETSLAAAIASLWVWLLVKKSQHSAGDLKEICGFGVLFLITFLTRPELIVFGAGYLVVRLFSVGRRVRFLVGCLLAVGLLFAVFATVMNANGLAIMTNAAQARRLSLRMKDASLLPLLGLAYSPDAIVLTAVLFPLLMFPALHAIVRKRVRRPFVLLWAYGLGSTAVLVVFFTLYYYTTWRGRYLVPAFAALFPFAVVGLSRFSRQGVATALATSYFLVVSVVVMIPLAQHSDAPAKRRMIGSERWISPPQDARTFLVQEVQSAYYHPSLDHISTDGLIDMNALEAYAEDVTVYDFIVAQRPDLVGVGRYFLKDPDGMAQRIRSAASEQATLEYRRIRLRYLGVIRGAGPVFDLDILEIDDR